ncbi:transposase [Dactylosporangium sp. NPDC049742]|uniref:transposase n=1 Tax=Dactylosporangium sp. NPDC049742 TaxID=3154737 RepID=UPI00342E3EC9
MTSAWPVGTTGANHKLVSCLWKTFNEPCFVPLGRPPRRSDRSKPGRPRQARQQDPCHGRAWRPAVDDGHLRGQHPRRGHPAAAAGRHARGGGPARPTPPPVHKLHADKAYDHKALRAQVRRRGITVRIARKKVESSQRLGRHRWVIERTLSWLMRYRRLVRRYDRYATHFAAFTTIACTLICYRKLLKTPK